MFMDVADRRKYISLNSVSYFFPGYDIITYRDCHGINKKLSY